jgi:hypothetical protein
MNKVFKSGNGNQTNNKKIAEEIGAVLVKLGKIPLYDNGLPVDCIVTTAKKSKLMVINAKTNKLFRADEPDQQCLIFTYDGSRLLVVGVPSYKQLQQRALDNKKNDVTWSEVLGFSQRGHFTVA